MLLFRWCQKLLEEDQCLAGEEEQYIFPLLHLGTWVSSIKSFCCLRHQLLYMIIVDFYMIILNWYVKHSQFENEYQKR